ncbi:unnamed protein product [Bemisia tabaci]|uniref:Uncharacterized protein n=1 Tax=Bemisia tabaci TaxID=7038 RepID=A0A9P0A5H4_BEMTA|nr:unnamed protein product [Bemisia tabaci]
MEISLRQIKECTKPNNSPINSTVTIQIIQRNEDLPITTISCKITVLRLVQHCSMFGDMQTVANSLANFYPEITLNQCKNLIETRKSTEYGTIINLNLNGFTERTVLLAGIVKENSNCEGASYSDSYGSYDDVVVHATLKFELYESEAMFNPKLDEIYLKTGVKCVYSTKSCFDPIRGYTFWDPSLDNECNDKYYSVLYEGPAYKIRDSNRLEPISYLVDEEDVAFSLKAIKTTRICHQEAYQTEYPRFYIVPQSDYEFTFRKSQRKVTAELLTYFNIKFLFLERHLSRAIQKLHESLSLANCMVERQILEHHLSLAIHHSDEFAYIRGGGPGWTAISMGEVCYLIQCKAVPVDLRPETTCYNEIPVSYKNESMFLSPRTRILTHKGTEIDCSNQLPVKFHIDDQWYAFVPRVQTANAPLELEARSFSSWYYKSPRNILKAGIYTEEDLAAYQRRISYPLESSALNLPTTSNSPMWSPPRHRRCAVAADVMSLGTDSSGINRADRLTLGCSVQSGRLDLGPSPCS